MFISSAQCDLIEQIYEIGQLGVADCNISVLSALRVRGLVEVTHGTKPGTYSYAELTDAGVYAADNIEYYRKPPKFADVRAKLRKDKWGY
jgi:hypothetical protein